MKLATHNAAVALNHKALAPTFLLCIYKLLVDLSYVSIYSIFEYWGLFGWEPSPTAYITGWCLALAATPAVLYCVNSRAVSSTIILLLIMCSWVPFTALVGHRADYPADYVVTVSLYYAMLYTFYRIFPRISLGSIKKGSWRLLYPVAILLTIVVLYVWWFHAGMHLQFTLFSGVYEQRAAARQFEIHTLIAYLLLLADNILPLLMAFFFFKKRFVIALILAVATFINFSISASKQIVILLAIAITAVLSRKIEVSNFMIMVLLCLGLCSVFAELAMLDTSVLSTLFPYRILFIPTELHYAYYSFFSEGAYDFYRQGPLKFFMSSQYETNIGFLVGEYAIGDITARANNGLFSSAFMNIGYAGSIISPVFVALYLRLLDGVSAGLPGALKSVIAAYVTIVLISIPLYTALLSSGFLGLILFLYLMRSTDFENSSQRRGSRSRSKRSHGG